MEDELKILKKHDISRDDLKNTTFHVKSLKNTTFHVMT